MNIFIRNEIIFQIVSILNNIFYILYDTKKYIICLIILTSSYSRTKYSCDFYWFLFWTYTNIK